VLLGLGIVAAVGIGGALFVALQPNRETTGSELYNTNNRTTPDGLANLPRDYAASRASRRSSVRRYQAISADRSSMPVRPRPACQRRRRPPIPRSSA
jgi:hypothetical protein